MPLRCSGPHARYTDVFNEYIALADRPGKSLKFHRDGDRSLAIVGLQRGIPSKRESSARVDYVPALCTHRPSLLPIEWSGEVLGSRATWAVRRARRRENSTEPYHLEEGEVVTRIPWNHRVFERKLRPKPSGRGHACLGVTHRVAPNHASLIGTHGIGAEIGLPCLWCGWPKLESPSVDARLVVVEKTLVLCRASDSLSNGERTGDQPSLKIGRPRCPNCSLEKRPQRRTGPKSPGRGRQRGTDSKQVPRGKDEKDFEKRVKECLKLSGREANGGRRCVPVGCGTAIAGPPIDSGRGPVRIGAAAKARAVDRLVEMPSRRSWLAARAVSAIYLRAPGTGLWAPHSARLKHGPRSLTCVRVNGE
ncbi:hypothetical protein L1887_56392 [Cichorium endivia]|nr:hypothetical protein L1887_56392 [Cichorium endivia]